ncbi:MAG: SDR family oxidoreductase [Myxococcales bacterium]|nr:SDR family oxidoreductase [Myxococcales bacterium]
MQNFKGKIAVITGAGTGMGRELALQLASEGCHVAFCDVAPEALAKTEAACKEAAPEGTRVSGHLCDVSNEDAVRAFRDAVAEAHQSDHIHLLFNNAGIGGTISFVAGDRADWERTFNVCWFGVYYCARAFLPMLIASDGGVIVNTSSVNGFWASLGPTMPHTAYSSAKFAVKGFTESLITDLRVNAPHVKAALVMPGHVGTDIALNSRKLLRKDDADAAEEAATARKRMAQAGMSVDGLSDEQILAAIEKRLTDFRDRAPLSAAGAATIILDGVREGRWRILVGEDAKMLDSRVRENPEGAYEADFFGAAAARPQRR